MNYRGQLSDGLPDTFRHLQVQRVPTCTMTMYSEATTCRSMARNSLSMHLPRANDIWAVFRTKFYTQLMHYFLSGGAFWGCAGPLSDLSCRRCTWSWYMFAQTSRPSTTPDCSQTELATCSAAPVAPISIQKSIPREPRADLVLIGPTLHILIEQLRFEFVFVGGGFCGSMEAALRLDLFTNTIAFIRLNLSPTGCT
jgi:hypothetical protein